MDEGFLVLRGRAGDDCCLHLYVYMATRLVALQNPGHAVAVIVVVVVLS
jgi:hypothetical protein